MARKKLVRKFAVREIGGERMPGTPAEIVRTWQGSWESEPLRLSFLGYGAYPYDCGSRDKFPDAAVYGNADAWVWDCERIGPDGLPVLAGDMVPVS